MFSTILENICLPSLDKLKKGCSLHRAESGVCAEICRFAER